MDTKLHSDEAGVHSTNAKRPLAVRSSIRPKHKWHSVDYTNYNVYINDHGITKVESKDGKQILYDGGTQNDHADDIYISETSIVTSGLMLNHTLFLNVWNSICPADCMEEDRSPSSDVVSLSECHFDIKEITKPRYLGEVIGCYRLYKNMKEFGMKIMVIDLANIFALYIGSGHENILFEYICRVKKYDTLIFVHNLTDAISKVGMLGLENVKLCQNRYDEYRSREYTDVPDFGHDKLDLAPNESDQANPYYTFNYANTLDLSAFVFYMQIRDHCVVSPHEVIYALNHNRFDYRWNNRIMNCVVYGEVYVDSDSMMISMYEKYIDTHFSNFTNDTSYNIHVPRPIYYYPPLYIIVDDGPEIKDFVKCLTKNKNNYTIIILCDGDKEMHNVLRVDKHCIPQIIIYRDKNKKLILP